MYIHLYFYTTIHSYVKLVRKMAEIIEYIPELKGIDLDIFRSNLSREITPEEIREVRKWALGSRSLIE